MNNNNNTICYCRTCNGIIHVIQSGDTLYTLSQKYNVNLEDIMYANSNVNVYNLQVGQKVCIPTGSGFVQTPNMNFNNNMNMGGVMNNTMNDTMNNMTNDRMNDTMNNMTDDRINDTMNNMMNDRMNDTMNDTMDDRMNNRMDDRMNDRMNENMDGEEYSNFFGMNNR